MAKTNEYQNLDMQHNEIQNVKGHQCNTVPDNVQEAQFWYDTVNKVFKFFNGTASKLFGKEYTFSTGLTNSSDTITVTDYDKLCKNTATGTDSIIIGNSGTVSNNSVSIGSGAFVSGSYDNGVAIGKSSTVSSGNSTAVGYGSKVDTSSAYSTAIGATAEAKKSKSTALGYGAIANGIGAIQIGEGTNTTNYSLQIGFNDGEDVNTYQLLNGATGLIPDARLSSNIARISDIPTTAAEVNALPDTTLYGRYLDVSLDTTNYKLTIKLKDKDNVSTLSQQTVDFPIESVVVNGSYDSTNQKLVLTLQNGNTIDIPVAGLISGLQAEITSSNKLSADLISDGITNKTVTQTEKDGWDGKQNAISDLATIRSGAALGATALQPVRNDLITLLGFEPVRKYVYKNPSLTVSGGQVTWSIANPFSSRTDAKDVTVQVFDDYDVAVGCAIDVGTSTIDISMNSSTNVSANSYKAVIMG